MDENLFETQYNVTKKSKLKRFYEENKILLYSSIFILMIFIFSLIYYLDTKERKQIISSDNYIEAKVFLEKGKKNEAKNILKNLVVTDDGSYSILSLFLLLNENLIIDENELSSLFDHVLKNNKFDEEVNNLIIYKKALFQSNYVDEAELLESLKPLINKETLWKPHALLLLGDYFFSKQENLKAKEFYVKILSIKSLNKELHDYVRSQLIFIVND